MKRRNVIKTIAISAVTPRMLLAGNGKQRSQRKSSLARGSFESRWQEWPDMSWLGPEYWGNRLQDWELKNGKAVCGVRGKNRSLHCLTVQLSGRREAFETRATLQLRPEGASQEDYAGFRIGAKGPFNDYRSAAVFGEGLDAGITAEGALFIGDQKGTQAVNPAREHVLSLNGKPGGSGYTLTLSVHDPDGGKQLAEMQVKDVTPEELEGNLALVAHSAGDKVTLQPSAEFGSWKISGAKADQEPGQVFGPVCFAQYTLHKKTLKLTAQLAPVEAVKGHKVILQVKRNNTWQNLKESPVDPLSRTAEFKVGNWAENTDTPYRVQLELPLLNGNETYFYEGTIAGEPSEADQLKVAVFSCNGDFGFPDSEVVRHVGNHRPGLALFLGDQFYERTGGFGIETSPPERAALDYLRKWYMFGWSYRDIYRHIPAAIIPDDHDAYHGNVWGEAGKVAPTDEGWGYPAQDQGGYKMPPEWLNMMQRTQTSHLPDPYDPRPVKQGIGVYYTSWNYAGISFAILEDRKFKTAPKNILPPEAKVTNGFIQNRDFDIKQHYDIDADLLGERQMDFLEAWSADWSEGVQMKAVLSQTNFCTVATLPEGSIIDSIVPRLPIPEPGEYVPGDAPTSDMDSNGWPQKGRDEAIRQIRKCFAFHIAGDQHLASTVQYGVDEFGDAGFAFAGPALNNIFPRRWWPPVDDHQALDGQPPYTGDFQDGFGNRMTVHAVANPHKTGRKPAIVYDRSTGYGMVVFDKERRTIRIECWPRYADPLADPGAQYKGWPQTVAQQDNYGRKAFAYLPELQIEGLKDPVIQLTDKESGELEYTIRIKGNSFKPKVFRDSVYHLRVGDPDKDLWKIYDNLKPLAESASIKCVF